MAFALKNIISHESKNTVHPSAPCSDTFCHYNVEVKKYFDRLTRKRISNTLWSAFETRSSIAIITSIRNFAQRILSKPHFVFDCCSQYLRSDPGRIPYLHPAAVTVHVFQN